jgi:hypothetical protein
VCSLSLEEWNNGPLRRVSSDPFVSLHTVIPSRYAIAFDESVNLDMRHNSVAFIALDAEKVWDNKESKGAYDVGKTGDNDVPFGKLVKLGTSDRNKCSVYRYLHSCNI